MEDWVDAIMYSAEDHELSKRKATHGVPRGAAMSVDSFASLTRGAQPADRDSDLEDFAEAAAEAEEM